MDSLCYASPPPPLHAGYLPHYPTSWSVSGSESLASKDKVPLPDSGVSCVLPESQDAAWCLTAESQFRLN